MVTGTVKIDGSGVYILDRGVWKSEDGSPVENPLLKLMLQSELDRQEKTPESKKPEISVVPAPKPLSPAAVPVKPRATTPQELVPPTLPRVIRGSEEPSPVKPLLQQVQSNLEAEMSSSYMGKRFFDSIVNFIKNAKSPLAPDNSEVHATKAQTAEVKPPEKRTSLDSIQKDVSDITKMLKEQDRLKNIEERKSKEEKREAEDVKDEARTQEAIKEEEKERGKGKYLPIGEEINRSFGRNLVAELPGLNLLKEARMMQQNPNSGIGGTDIIGGLLPSSKFLKTGLKAGAAGLVLGGGSYLMDQQAQDAVKEGDKQTSAAWKVGSKAAEWGAYGAMAGSFIPGVGTLAGGAIAGLGGAVVGAAENWDDLWGEEPKKVSPNMTIEQKLEKEMKSSQQLIDKTEKMLREKQQKTKDTNPPFIVNNNQTINNNSNQNGGTPSLITAGTSGSLFALPSFA